MRKYISNGLGGQIHLAEAGTKTRDKPSLLLIHQTPRSWDEFREVIALLKSNHHVVAMDLPGMGASSSIGPIPTIETYSKAAARVIEHIDAGSMIICGHHTGGVVAIDLAASRPELASSLILSSTPWVDAKSRKERAQKTPIDTITASRDGQHLMDLWQQRSPYYPKETQYMDRYIATALQAASPAEGHHAVGHYHMEKAIPKIKCPVLLIEHMKDPFAVKHTNDLMVALPGAKLERIPNGRVAVEPTAAQFAEILHRWAEPNDDKPK